MSHAPAKPLAIHSYTWQDLERASIDCQALAEDMSLMKWRSRYKNPPETLDIALRNTALTFAEAVPVVCALAETLLLASALQAQRERVPGGHIRTWHEWIIKIVTGFLYDIWRKVDSEGLQGRYLGKFPAMSFDGTWRKVSAYVWELAVSSGSDLGNKFPVDAASQRWSLVRAVAARLPRFDLVKAQAQIACEGVLAIREMQNPSNGQAGPPAPTVGEQTDRGTRAIAILLSAQQRGLRVRKADIAKAVGVDRTTMHRSSDFERFNALWIAYKQTLRTNPPRGYIDAKGKLEAEE